MPNEMGPTGALHWKAVYKTRLIDTATFVFTPHILTEYLQEKDDMGWGLVSIFPVLGIVVVVHRMYRQAESEDEIEARNLIAALRQSSPDADVEPAAT